MMSINLPNNKQLELLTNLKADLNAAKGLRNSLDSKIAKWRKEYDGEPYGNEVPNKSRIISRDIKKQSEWQHAALIEPFVSTPDIIKASPVTHEDAIVAPKIEILLNTQFCRQFERFKFMSKALKVLDIEGTCVVRTGWDYKEKVVKQRIIEDRPNPDLLALQQESQQIQAYLQQLAPLAQQGDPNAQQQAEALQAKLQELEQLAQQIPPTIQVAKVIDQMMPVVNKPTAKVCRNEDIFTDPTCGDDFNQCQFIIHKYETDLSTLKQNPIYKNIDQVQSQTYKDDINRRDSYLYDNSFTFTDLARKKLTVYEYWGNYDINDDGIAEPIVCAWIGDVVIRLEENPFPDKKPPFIITSFTLVPESLYGESNAELLSDVQKMKTAIYRGFIDNMANSNNGQKGIKKGALDAINVKRYLNGQNFEFNGVASDFFEGSFNELPQSAFNILQLMNNEAESITGVSSFNTGMNGSSLGATATSVRGVLDSASSRRLNIVRNISENLVKPLLRKWLAYSAEFLDEESQIRITNDEFVWLKREDLGANIDIDLTISTSDDNQSKASELAFMLQTIGPHEDPNVRRIIMAEIARLYRMPDLAKMLREYEPQPDPMQIRLQELQVALLEAQVANEQSKAEENAIDRELKGAKAQTELAKARKLESDADKLDLDYLNEFRGETHKRNMEMQNNKQNFEFTKELMKHLAQTKKQNL